MIVQKNMKKCYPSLRRVCLAVSRQLGPSNSGQESSAAAVLACAIMPSEVQKNMKKCYPAHPSNVSASRCRGSLLCPSNSRQKGRNTQPPFNPSVGSLCHFCATATRLSYRFPIFETSATALCGTTGMIFPFKVSFIMGSSLETAAAGQDFAKCAIRGVPCTVVNPQTGALR